MHNTGCSLSIPTFQIRFLATQLKISTCGLLQHLEEIGTFCLVYDNYMTILSKLWKCDRLKKGNILVSASIVKKLHS